LLEAIPNKTECFTKNPQPQQFIRIIMVVVFDEINPQAQKIRDLLHIVLRVCGADITPQQQPKAALSL